VALTASLALAVAFVIGREYPSDATCFAAVTRGRPEPGEAIEEQWRKLSKELETAYRPKK